MNKPSKFSVSIFVIIGLATAIHAETESVRLGDATIALPAPEGYFRHDGKSQKVDRYQQTLNTGDNRLLAAFCSEDDLAEVLTDTIPLLERFFMAQSVRKFETESVTAAEFRKTMNFFRTQMDTMRQQIGDRLPELERKVSSNLSKELQTTTDFKVGEVVPLGIFDETADSLSFSVLAKVLLTGANGEEPVEQVSMLATTVVYLRNRMVYLVCRSRYKDKQDIEWVRVNVKKWRDQVLAANPSQIGSSASSSGAEKTADRKSSTDKIGLGSVVLLLSLSACVLRLAARQGRKRGALWAGGGVLLGFILPLVGIFVLIPYWHISEKKALALVDMSPLVVPLGPLFCLLWLYRRGPIPTAPPKSEATPTKLPPKGTTTEKGYFLLQSGGQSGPFTLKQLREMMGRGEIATTATYRFETADSWQPITKLAQLLKP